MSFDKNAVAQAAQTLATADKAFTSAIETVAQSVARLMGTKPSYDQWEGVRSAFVEAYRAARGCEDKTAANRWSYVAEEMRSRYALEKPTKPTEGAAKKAAQREGRAAKVDALIAQHGNVQALMEAAKKADPKDASLYGDAIAKASRSAASDATKAAKEAEKALRDEARTIVNKLTGKQLEKAVAVLRKLAPAE